MSLQSLHLLCVLRSSIAELVSPANQKPMMVQSAVEPITCCCTFLTGNPETQARIIQNLGSCRVVQKPWQQSWPAV